MALAERAESPHPAGLATRRDLNRPPELRQAAERVAETQRVRESAPDQTEGAGGIRLLLSDVRVAGLVLNEARYRALEQLLGVSRDQANAATFVMVLMLAESLHEKGTRLRPALPSLGDTALGLSTVREGIYGLAGPSTRDTPLVGTLVSLALVAAIARPGVRAAVHGVRSSSDRMRVAFRHRYGHLVHHARRRTRGAHPARTPAHVIVEPGSARQSVSPEDMKG